MFRETDRKFQETSAEIRATSKEVRETSRLVKELGQPIGGLGNKFGSFTEGLALPSMQKILGQRFGVDMVSPSVRLRRESQHLEIDVLAYANGDINAAYVVEVKSHLKENDIEQLLKILERFPVWFPEHRNKALYCFNQTELTNVVGWISEAHPPSRAMTGGCGASALSALPVKSSSRLRVVM